MGSGRAGEAVHRNAGWVLGFWVVGFWVDMNLMAREAKNYM